MPDEQTKITRQDIREWIESTTGDWFYIDDVKKQLHIQADQYPKLRRALHEFCKEDLCEALGGKTGRYRKKVKSKASLFWQTNGSGDFPITHPYGVNDQTTFGFEDAFTFKRGSSYIIGGVTQAGKTTYALNLLWNNMDDKHIKFFCSESNRYKFWDRAQRMDWNTPFKKENPETLEDCKFEFISKDDNFIDDLEGADMYIIDWLNVTDEVWKVGLKIQKMVNKVDRQGEGIIVVVLQKSGESKYARGGSWTLDFADFGVVLDSGRLTVLKCKQAGKLDNKMWTYDISMGGSRFHNIYEAVKCPKCYGFSAIRNTKCEKCKGKGYISLHSQDEDSDLPF